MARLGDTATATADPDVPIPYSHNLENEVISGTEDVAEAVRSVR